MKTILSLLLILCLTLPLFGCASNTVRIESPANFYYRRNEISYWQEDGVIQSETREIAGMETEFDKILALYLSGPQSDTLRSVFPKYTKLLSFEIVDNTAYLSISNDLQTLTGMDLTIACTCLAITTMDLTNAEIVQIQTELPFPDGSNVRIIDKSCLILLDDSAQLIYESNGGNDE